MTALNYSTGTISLTNGSAVVTGVGTAWQIALITGGTIYVQAAGNPLPIDTVDSDTQITAALQWTGATGSYAYVLRIGTVYNEQIAKNAEIFARILAEIDAGTIWKYDAAGDAAGRSAYDTRPKGFGYLDISSAPAKFWVKSADTSGAWAGPFAYAQGEQGVVGPAGLVNWRGTYAGATAYAKNDGVYYNGSAFIALQATTGHAPPTLPTTANAYWSLMAIKGTDGAGGGDVTGPATSTTGRPAVFADATGKLLAVGAALFSGAYADLSGKPTLGNAAARNVGTAAGTVAAGDDARFSADSYVRLAQVATTSGTAFDFAIDPNAVEITLDLADVGFSAADAAVVQLGTASGLVTALYDQSVTSFAVSALQVLNPSAGFYVSVGIANRTPNGSLRLRRIGTSNTWTATHITGSNTAESNAIMTAGTVELPDRITQLRLTRNGSATFNSGLASVEYRT